VREWILAAAADPVVGAMVLALGLAGIIAEFVWPGKVIPGALGGLLTLVALWSLWPKHTWVVAGVAAPFVAVAVVLLRIGIRARRNKFTLR
jgi:membrane-bound ClpP family serine protease